METQCHSYLLKLNQWSIPPDIDSNTKETGRIGMMA